MSEILGVRTTSWMAKEGGWSCGQQVLHRGFWPALSGQERALIRSQTGLLSAMPFIAFLSSSFSRFDPQPFRVLLLRRLHLPLLSARQCRCGRPLDPCGSSSVRVCCGRGSWAKGVTRWRVPLPGFAGRRVRGSAPMSRSGTWIFCLQPPWMAEDWKLLPMVCLSAEAHNWRLTQTLVAVPKRDGTPRTGSRQDQWGGACFGSATQGAHLPRALR